MNVDLDLPISNTLVTTFASFSVSKVFCCTSFNLCSYSGTVSSTQTLSIAEVTFGSSLSSFLVTVDPVSMNTHSYCIIVERRSFPCQVTLTAVAFTGTIPNASSSSVNRSESR